MTFKPLIMSLMTMLCSLFGCTAQTIGFRSVEAEEFGRIIADTTQAVTRLDVRTAAEYAEGHIANAVNIDVLDGNFESRATGKLPKDKTVAVYCRSGKRSKKAAAILVRNGYSVVELNSGYMGWTKAACQQTGKAPTAHRDKQTRTTNKIHIMQKRFLSLLAVIMISIMTMAQSQVKYVFYFIGDGMGVNQVNVTETYLAALKGRIGFEPILMSSLPVVGLVNTYSGTNGVTDSAAGGTALATGSKTKNGALGLTVDLQNDVQSVASWAKDTGAAVGVATSVAVDHATPAAFYAHVPKRQMYYEIGKQLIASGYDYFGGSDFHKANEKPEEGSLYEQAAKAGYTIAKGYNDYMKKARTAGKMILLQSDEANSKLDHDRIPYAIDRKKGDLTLEEITRAGINFLSRQQKNGFFLMVEGGMIDYACHRNDIGTVINEVLDMDKAIKVAYEFYSQHPDETIIIISADHETGGLVMGKGPYELHTDLLRFQKMSKPEFQRHLNDLYKKHPKRFNWTLVEKELKAQFGFGDGITLTDEQTARLKKRWTAIEDAVKDNGKVNERINDLGETACRIISEAAMISWASGGHSNGYVPIYAIGPGTEVFQGRIDNIEIAPAIGKITGWKKQ